MPLSKSPRLQTNTRSRLESASIVRLSHAGPATRILIVDLDRQVGVALSFMLATRQFEEVRAVRSPGRALAVAARFQPEIVFIDLDLPGGGITMARQIIREAGKRRTRLIALSRQLADPTYEQARSAGFERLLVKPVAHDELDKVLGIGRTAA